MVALTYWATPIFSVIGQIGKLKKSPWDKEEEAQVEVPERPQKGPWQDSKAKPTSAVRCDVLGPKDLSFWRQVPTETLPWVAVRGWGAIWVPLGAYACMLSHLSRVWLFKTLWTLPCQAPLSLGFPQARILKWVAIPFSRVSSQPRGWTHLSYVSYIGWRGLHHQCHLEKPLGVPTIP